MPVDRVKEIDPISSAVTEPLRDSPWDKIGIQIHIPQLLVEDLSKEEKYRKSRDGYGDSSSDHVNYEGLAAASPSTSECWHALLPEPPCLGPAEKDCSGSNS